MAEITIEWDRSRLVVAQGRVSETGADLSLLKVIERPEDSGDTLSVVQALQELFPRKSDRRKLQAAVVFPRQLVTVHRIQLPQVPDAEIPELLRLQATMKLTVPVDSVCMDFTPLPIQAGSPTRDVLLVTVPGDQLAIVRRTLNDSGIELVEARVSAYCIAQALEHAGLLRNETDSEGVDIVAVMRRDFLELTFLRGRTVLFSHSGSSWASADVIERTLRSELSRARMSAAETLGDQKIRRLMLIGSPEITSQVTDQFASRFDGAVIERIDPAASLISGAIPKENAAADAVAVMGAMISGSESKIQIVDFISPRKAAPKRDMRRIRILGGILAGVLLFGGITMYRSNRVAALTKSLAAVESENSEIREALEAGARDLEFAGRIGNWVDRDIEWLDEFVRLRGLMPGTGRLFVDNFSMATVPQNGVGIVRFEAWAKSESDINELTRKLRDAGYGVKPFDTDLRPSAVSQEYQIRVQLEVVLPDPKQKEETAS